MKKFLLVPLTCGLATLLNACSEGFDRAQTMQQMNSPYSCIGLHQKHAQWHFVDDFGQRVDATGNCVRGMKHGTFEFYVNGLLASKVKFIKDEERKSICFFGGKQTMNLISCMSLWANSWQQPPMVQPMPDYDESYEQY